jgi:serine/threonine-protein kinase
VRKLPKDDGVLTADDICLADFGLCVQLSYPFTLKAKLGCGTMAYHSPEQLDGQEYDSSVDIFALSIVVFNLMVGEHPFLTDGKLDLEKLRQANWAILEKRILSP